MNKTITGALQAVALGYAGCVLTLFLMAYATNESADLHFESVAIVCCGFGVSVTVWLVLLGWIARRSYGTDSALAAGLIAMLVGGAAGALATLTVAPFEAYLQPKETQVLSRIFLAAGVVGNLVMVWRWRRTNA